MTREEYEDLEPWQTEALFEAVGEKHKRLDRLLARIGVFVFQAQGAKKASGGQWRESDFLPKPAPTPEAEAMMMEIQARKLKAAQRKAKGNG